MLRDLTVKWFLMGGCDWNSTAEALEEELERVRGQGYAVDDEEQELGVRCVAVPVDLHGGRMALLVSGPTERMTQEEARRVVADLTRVAQDLAGRARGS